MQGMSLAALFVVNDANDVTATLSASSWRLHFALCKGIQKIFASIGIRENFAFGIRNPGFWKPEYKVSIGNSEFKFH